MLYGAVRAKFKFTHSYKDGVNLKNLKKKEGEILRALVQTLRLKRELWLFEKGPSRTGNWL